MSYIDCWVSAAKALFGQAIAEDAELTESSPGHSGEGACGFVAKLQGGRRGRFTVILDPAMLSMPLLGDVADQKLAWGELLREVADAAAGQLFAITGEKCQVAEFAELTSGTQASRAFELRLSTGGWTIRVQDESRGPASEANREPE